MLTFFEHVNQHNTLILKKGHILFHSSGEEFEGDLKVGGYDKVLWTAEDSAISQSYIPISSLIQTTTRSLSYPSKSLNDITQQIGLKYDLDSLVYEDDELVSYKALPEINKIYEKQRELSKKWDSLEKELKSLNKKHLDITNKFISTDDDSDAHFDKYEKETGIIQNRITDIQKEITEVKRLYNLTDPQKALFKLTNQKLRDFGYVPDNEDEYSLNHNWKLKVKYNGDDNSYELLPSDYRGEGRLFILTAKKDIKIFTGDNDEGDLTNLEYHNIRLFRTLEKSDYDGLRINDFAQVEGEGNFGHKSIGIFADSISKFDVKSIPARHPANFNNNHIKPHDYESKEYKEYLGKNEIIQEKKASVPTNKGLWDKAIRLVKGTKHGGSSYVTVNGKRYDAPNDGKGFSTYPSAYSNSYAAKMYKKWGGSWKTNEDLRDWHKEEWVRIDTQGNITGECGTMKDKNAPTRCLPKKKANSLSKAERKATVSKKKEGGKEGKKYVKNTKKAEVKK